MINIIRNFKFVIRNSQKGMTLIELVVVLAIFAVLSGVAMFNYGSLETKIDLTNLSNDIALQVVQAQNSALSGLLPIQSYDTSWKPSYGVYFSSGSAPSAGDSSGADYKDFIYFVNLNNSTNLFDGNSCPPPPSSTNECLSKYTITKNDYISNIYAVYTTSNPPTYTTGDPPTKLDNLTITFTRPNSGAILKSTSAFTPGLTLSYVEITIVDQTGKIFTHIDLYPSGRVQIN